MLSGAIFNLRQSPTQLMRYNIANNALITIMAVVATYYYDADDGGNYYNYLLLLLTRYFGK
jgi:hypothetical protein